MRVRFLVDGFNLYHSVKAAEKHLGAGPLRWLNVHALCQTIIQSSLGPGYTLDGIHYFSALAKHLERRKPDVVERHKTFIAALKSTGVDVTLANFKRKERPFSLADMRLQVKPFRQWFRVPTKWIRLSAITHEEKETDVAIACKLLELLCQSKCEVAILLTGDTDIAPAIRTAKTLYPTAKVGVAFPFKRHNRDLEKLVTLHIRISAELYQKHQFPDPVTVGTKYIQKPASW
jgi:hypothetical protein